AICLEQRTDGRGDSRLGARRELDVEPGRRASEAVQVLLDLGRAAAARAHRVEHAVAELEAAVEGGEVPRIRGQQIAVDPDVAAREGRCDAPCGLLAHATSRAPIAESGPRALATVSSHSAAGSLRQVIPPPTWSVSRSPSATNERIRMLEPIAPSGPSQPALPGYGPRRTGSS